MQTGVCSVIGQVKPAVAAIGAGFRRVAVALGTDSVWLEYETDRDDARIPYARLVQVRHDTLAIPAEAFTTELQQQWAALVEADLDAYISELIREAEELLAERRRRAALEPCPVAAAAAEDQFIRQREAAL